MIITIDGPAGSGKSTIAKQLAEYLGYIYFDTGAMYRAITYAVIDQRIDPDDVKKITECLETFDLQVRLVRGHKRYFVGEEDVTDQIRSTMVTALVSKISAHAIVREKMVAIQRQAANGVHAVFEGRDMGSVVFPHAELKIFLDARPEVRAQRRYEELLAEEPHKKAKLQEKTILEEINKRDSLDSSRAISPLRQAEDAHRIDTSDISVTEIVKKILELKDSLKQHSKA